jgi:very-short-patch-repair endonuclease
VSHSTAIVGGMERLDTPFLGQQAVRAGDVTARRLQKDFRAVYRNVYVPKRFDVDAATRARAAWLWAGGDCTLTGLSAAAMHGAKWIDGGLPAEMIRADRHSPSGIAVHAYALRPDEVCTIDGMQLTTPARTAFDIGRTRATLPAVIHLDALARATRVKPSDVLAIAESHPGGRGVRRLREAVARMDGGSESPQETRVRLLLVDGGLPIPETQIEFRDQYGVVRVRVDMGWREWKVAVEYDGVQHWSDRRQRSWDIDRIAMLESVKWVVVRVSAEMLDRPDVILQRVLEKLRAAGCPI